MMLADARFPSGGFAQSGGLEAAVRAGLTDVPGFAASRLRTATAVDAGTAVVARAVARVVVPAGPPVTSPGPLPGVALGQPHSLSAVEAAWAARTPSRPLRDAARLTGRGYLRLAGRLWPAVREHLPDHQPPRPIVLGVVGAVTGLSGLQVARLVGYDDVQTVASAALKLLPLDPAEVAGWVLSLHGQVEQLAASVADLSDPDDIPDPGAPALDVHAERHRRAETRLFHV